MGKGKGRLNPADAQRRKDKKNMKKRNRDEKQMAHEMAKLGDPEAILNELKGQKLFFFSLVFLALTRHSCRHCASRAAGLRGSHAVQAETHLDGDAQEAHVQAKA